MRNFIISLSLFFLYIPLYAQSLRVNDYVKEVYNYSLAIKSSRENTKTYFYTAEQARRNFYPRFDAALSAAYTFRDYTIIPGVSLQHFNGSMGVNLTQNIYSGSSVKSSVALAETMTDISRYRELHTIENIILAASSMYWQVVAAKAYLDVAHSYLEIINSNYDLLNIKFKEGLLAKNDVLMMQTRKQQAEYGLVQAQKYFEKVSSDYNILRGKNVSESISLSDSIMVDNAILPVYTQPISVMQDRNEFNISELMIKQSIVQMKSNQAVFLPQISVGVGGTYGTQSINFDNSLILDGQAFLKVSVPIFAWGQRRQKRLSDKAIIKANEYNLESTVDNIKKEIADSYIALTENYEQLSVTDSSLKIARESLDLSIFAFDEGMISVLELLASQLSWLSAYNSKIQANMSYRISLLTYKKSTGDLNLSY